jgi:archaemetzincin
MVTLYRLNDDPDFVYKECVHELGHVFGLGHCTLPCVMTFSNSVAEAHMKNMDFCSACQVKLSKYPSH